MAKLLYSQRLQIHIVAVVNIQRELQQLIFFLKQESNDFLGLLNTEKRKSSKYSR